MTNDDDKKQLDDAADEDEDKDKKQPLDEADDAVDFSPPTEPHQQGPDLHEDSSPRATTRQRNTKDPYDLISSNSKIRALERRETTGRHEFTARRLA